ncbi:hypothetical protein GCM10025734_27460 [Kitasatospora paranensis]
MKLRPRRPPTRISRPIANASKTPHSTKNDTRYDQGSNPGSMITSAAPGGYCQVTSSSGNVPVCSTSYQPW